MQMVEPNGSAPVRCAAHIQAYNQRFSTGCSGIRSDFGSKATGVLGRTESRAAERTWCRPSAEKLAEPLYGLGSQATKPKRVPSSAVRAAWQSVDLPLRHDRPSS